MTTPKANPQSMDTHQRLRRVVLLCYHFARNLAYCRASRDGNDRLVPNTQFWRTVTGNCIEMAMLEWCKLLGDAPGKPKEHQGWERVVTNPAQFRADMLATIGLDEAGFEALRNKIREYRDSFIAHLDSEEVGHIAHLDNAQKAVWFMHDHICARADSEGLIFKRGDIQEYYDQHFREARAVYAKSFD